MSIPRGLSLRNTDEGLRMVQEPVSELQKLRTNRLRLRNASISEANDWFSKNNIGGALWEIDAELEFGKKPSDFSLHLLV